MRAVQLDQVATTSIRVERVLVAQVDSVLVAQVVIRRRAVAARLAPVWSPTPLLLVQQFQHQ